jgi:K+-transporting ATPase KdpF subunit
MPGSVKACDPLLSPYMETIITGVIALLLTGYLVVAMLRSERF